MVKKVILTDEKDEDGFRKAIDADEASSGSGSSGSSGGTADVPEENIERVDLPERDDVEPVENNDSSSSSDSNSNVTQSDIGGGGSSGTRAIRQEIDEQGNPEGEAQVVGDRGELGTPQEVAERTQRQDRERRQNNSEVQLTDLQDEDGFRVTQNELENRIRNDNTDGLRPAARTSRSARIQSRRNRRRNIRRQNQFRDRLDREPRAPPRQTNTTQINALDQDFQNNPFVRAENFAADRLETSLENVQESTRQARAASDNMSEFNPVSVTGRTIAGLENIGGEAFDAATGGSFDPLSEDSRAAANDRAQEIEKSIVGAFGGPATAPVDTATVVGAGVAAPLAGGLAEFTTGGEYDSEFAGDELRGASAQAIETQVESFLDDPVKEGAVGVIGFGAGAVASRTTRSASRTARSIDADTLPTTQRTSQTFNADNTNFADTLDPRTGVGRTPQPGEPTPAPFTQQATETARRARNFLGGDLGQRRATPEEVRNQFDQNDILQGDNLPENPNEPVRVDRTRREVLQDFISETPSFTGSRKGQAQLVSPVQKVKQTVDDIDTTGRDISISDRIDRIENRIRTPERSGNRIDSGSRSRDRGFDRPARPNTGISNRIDNAAGLGLGIGLDSDLGEESVQDNPLAQDQFPEEDTEQPPIEQPPENPPEEEIFRQDRTLLDPDEETQLRDELFRKETDRRTRRRPDLDFNNDNNFVFEDAEPVSDPGADLGNEFAPSLTAGLFNIQAGEDFDEDQTFSGFEIRPLVD